MLLAGATGGGHGTPCICGAGVEVEIVFCFCDSGGGGAGGVHQGFDNFGEGDVFICWEEVFHAAKQVLEISPQGACAGEVVGKAAAEGGEAAEDVVAPRGLVSGGGGRGHHGHAGDLADAFYVS